MHSCGMHTCVCDFLLFVCVHDVHTQAFKVHVYACTSIILYLCLHIFILFHAHTSDGILSNVSVMLVDIEYVNSF